MAFTTFGWWGKCGLVVSTLAFSGAAVALNYDAQYTGTAPVIDGTVDAVWSSASPAATGFKQHNNPAVASPQQTDVRVLWDTTHLYVLFEAQDEDIKTSATADDTAFDFGTPQDTAEIFLDPLFIQATSANDDKVYHVAVDPSPATYTYTEAGQDYTQWNLSSASDLAFSNNGANWKIEMALAWSDLNSTSSSSPGHILGAPTNGVVWGVQFGRLHGGTNDNSGIVASKWEPTSGVFRKRPFGSLTFKGGPAPTKPDLSSLTQLYSTSFEAPVYTAGQTASGIESWSATTPAVWPITSSVANSGSQALQANAGTGTTIRNVKRTTNTETAQYLQYALRLPLDVPGNGYRHVLYLGGEYTTGSDTLGQIWFTQNNTQGTNAFDVYNYETPGDEAKATGLKFAGLLPFNEWFWLTVKMSPDSNRYEVWINNTKLIRTTGEDYFTTKKNSIFQQFVSPSFYNKNFGTEPVFFDDVLIVEEPQTSSVNDWQLF